MSSILSCVALDETIPPLAPLPIFVTSTDSQILDKFSRCIAFLPLTITPHENISPPPTTPGPAIWLVDLDDLSRAQLSILIRQRPNPLDTVVLAAATQLHWETVTELLSYNISHLLAKPLDTLLLRKQLIQFATRLALQTHQKCCVDRLKKQFNALTYRQLAVLEGTRQGLAPKVIAHQLQLSDKTIRMHQTKLMKKFEVCNLTQLALQAQWWRLYCHCYFKIDTGLFDDAT